MARPLSRKINLRSGYYIEVKTKSSPNGIKIRRETEESCKLAYEQYNRMHDVLWIGKVD